MRPKDKVVNISFAVCAAFLFDDHLAFTANFQPTLVLPIIVGKLVGGHPESLWHIGSALRKLWL